MSGADFVTQPRRAGNLPAGRGRLPSPLPAPDDELNASEAATENAGDRAFLAPARQILETPPRWGAMAISCVLVALAFGGIAAASVFKTTIYAKGPGVVVAVGNSQVIESQVQNNVSAIRVQEGQHVKAGDILIELNPTDALAKRGLVAGKLADAWGRGIRMRAEIKAIQSGTQDTSAAIPWTPDIPDAIRRREADVMRGDLTRLAATYGTLDAERQAKEAARSGFIDSIAKQKAIIAIISEHLKMHETLAGIGVESQAKLLQSTLDLRRQQVALEGLESGLADATAAIVTIEAERTKARASLLADVQQTLAKAEREADDSSQALIRANDRLNDMTLRAPVDGTVMALAVTTPGQVAQVGQQLMQVVPDGNPLEVHAYVLNIDIGYVRVGQEVAIKIDTFPYTRYGTLRGTVIAVSPDAIPGKQALSQQVNASKTIGHGNLSETTAAEHVSDLVFPVTIRPLQTTIRVEGHDLPIRPGMSVVVEVETGRERAIAWVLYPLARAL
jgi:hemolysin D